MLDLRVLIVAPTRRDGEVTRRLLHASGVDSEACADLRALVTELHRGVGALVLTDAAIAQPDFVRVVEALGAQPAWSDVPVVVLCQDRSEAPASTRALQLLTNVTLLDRPASSRSMISAVQAALRARRRQYQIRDQLAQQQRAEDALREADRRKDEFLATLAHELRNPLAPIRTGMQVLARVPAGSDQFAELQRMMERQLVQLVKLIDELLDVSRISTGKVVLQRETVDMRAIVEAALEGSQPVLDAARHVVSVRLPPAPVWVHGDPSRLAQVVGNLLTNAAKYTPAGGAIDVVLDVEDGQAAVRVSDNGVGIPADMLEQVFVMFTQVDRTLDRAQGGLGIGLSLVRRLMDLHGGSVHATSPGLGRGSTFTVRLATTGTAPPQVPAEIAPTSAAGMRRLRVLVVDDNADAADSLALSLELDGYRTRTEYSGEAGLQAVDEFDPHVVLCDIGLPGIGGYEVATRLRADPRHAGLLLVAVTGWGSEEDQARSRAAGFQVHLVKPAGLDSVAGILQREETRLHAAGAV
ncbi:MAG TPA: ATP-binding protein [Luteimonas sp.]|nr:ATP-binding protein [Luteimonas sp.]